MTALTCLACLAVGFLGGFTFGFRIAAMIKLGVQRVLPSTAPASALPVDMEEVAP